MRLSTAQVETIKQETEHFFGTQAGVWLFGSRADGTARGGDVDLHVRATSSDAKASAAVQRGFTITELITVMVIIGILAATAVPKLFQRDVFDSRGFYDQTIATLRYAQKVAIAKHRYVCVSFPANNSITLTHGATPACADGTLAGPAGTSYPLTNSHATYALYPIGGFNFNALGKSSAQNIQVNGYPPLITVEAETGYVH